MSKAIVNYSLIPLMVLSLLFMLTACSQSQNEAATSINAKNNEVKFEFTDILYSPWVNELIEYNRHSGEKRSWNPQILVSQTMIQNADDLYIDHTTTYDDNNEPSFVYRVIQVVNQNSIDDAVSNTKVNSIDKTQDKIKTLYEFEPEVIVFPIAMVDDRLYFTQFVNVSHDPDIKEPKNLAYYDLTDNKVVVIRENIGEVYKGKVSRQHLYYAVYNERDNISKLYKLALTRDLSKYRSGDIQPELVKSNINSSMLFIKDGEVCTLQNSENPQRIIMCGDEQWPHSIDSVFRGDYLVQVDFNTNDNKYDDTDNPVTLALAIIDTKTNHPVLKATDFLGYKFVNDKIYIGTSSGMQTFDLKK